MLHHYAVKYLDENGLTVSTGYIETYGEQYNSGDIITDHAGNKIKIDFEI